MLENIHCITIHCVLLHNVLLIDHVQLIVSYCGRNPRAIEHSTVLYGNHSSIDEHSMSGDATVWHSCKSRGAFKPADKAALMVHERRDNKPLLRLLVFILFTNLYSISNMLGWKDQVWLR